MRILHVGAGFRPWRPGGLIAYVEDVAQAQAARGHDVTYFFSGRHLPRRRDPHLRRWRRGRVAMVELFNSPVMMSPWGTLRPDTNLSEPVVEAAFAAALERARPDVVHVQEISNLPSSLLELPRVHGVPVVLTVHDFQLLCPTMWLFDADQQRCYRRRPGEMCAVCCSAAPPDHAYLIRRTVEHMVAPGMRGAAAAQTVVDALRGSHVVRSAVQALRRPGPDAPPAGRAPAEAYDRRRDVNLQRMGDVDFLLPVSSRQAEICHELGVRPRRQRILHTTVRHLAGIRPAERVAPGTPMTFVTLNGCVNVAKGEDVVVEALRTLDAWGLAGAYRLDVWGLVSRSARAALRANRSARVRGTYAAADLSGILAEADVGLMPSVVEEAYGYTGVEMLAGGVPVIGNALGGVTDYVLPGRTGWLNRSAGGAELAELMRSAIQAPDEVEALRRDLRAHRPEAVKTMDEHLDALEAVYAEAVGQLPDRPGMRP